MVVLCKLISVYLAVVVVALFSSAEAVQCVDQDDVIGTISEQQTGQRWTCEAMGSVYPEMTCNDPQISKICCAQCSMDATHERWSKFGGAQQRLGTQLAHAPRLPLRGGGSMPALSLGTAGLRGLAGARAVEFALRSGYRALDSAVLYGSHWALGQGLRASGIPREEVFVTSKVWIDQMGFDRAAQSVQLMLDEMKLDYVDLCMLHWPFVDVDGDKRHTFQIVERAGAWRALEKAVDHGKCRYLGVSNYMPQHLRELFDYARILPAANQIEFHPYQTDEKTVSFCKQNEIVIQAYGTINAKGLLDDPAVLAVAKEVGRTPFQVLLRWGIQQDAQVLPKSAKEERLLENANLWDFELSAEQEQRMSALNRDMRTHNNPDKAPVIARFRKME